MNGSVRRLCFKLLHADERDALRKDGVFRGSAVDLADGFIHLSFADQVEETARRHFGGREGLWLVAVDCESLGPDLRLEPSRGGDLFPHLYRPLRSTDVAWERPLPLRDGRHVFPDRLADATAGEDPPGAGRAG